MKRAATMAAITAATIALTACGPSGSTSHAKCEATFRSTIESINATEGLDIKIIRIKWLDDPTIGLAETAGNNTSGSMPLTCNNNGILGIG